MTTEESDLPILIIGAGIGGLATALALQQAGLPVKVFERGNEIKESGAGLTLWPNAIKVLQQLGLNELTNTIGRFQTQAGFYDQKEQPLSVLSMKEVERKLGMPTLAVHRAELQSALYQKLKPDTVKLGAELTEFEQDETGVTACFADGQQVRGRLLIGADGIHSRVRHQMFPESLPQYAGYTAWRGIASHVDLPFVGEIWGRGLRFGIVPLHKERTYWFATRNAPEGRTTREGIWKQVVLNTFKDWHPVVTSLIEATPSDALLCNDIYDLKPLSRWSKGRVTLLGDAAHATTPNLGQGACQALEDTLVLASALHHAHTIPEALQWYQQKRLPRTSMIITRSRSIGRVGQWENPVACWLRNSLLKLTPPGLILRQLTDVAGYNAGPDSDIY